MRAPHRLLASASVTVAIVAVPSPAAADNDITYRPPVAAPVIEVFRPPSDPYGTGNRGIVYDTDVGDAVTASAAGTVVFAGAVAGANWVTVAHADGVRTSYGDLETITVERGQSVEQGAPLGTAGDRVHVGARVGDAYVDPAVLFALGPRRVHLVPAGPDAAAHRDWSDLRVDPSIPTMWGTIDRPGLAERAIGWLRDTAVDTVADTPGRVAIDIGRATMQWLAAEPCTPWRDVAATVARARTNNSARRRIAVLVGGLGSSSRNAAIDDVDVDALGYRSGDVLRFSYRGGRTPAAAAPSAELVGLDESTYESSDTDGDIALAGLRLSSLLHDVAERVPGVPIDVVAHSMGGLALRQALVELPADVRDQLGFVATIATPHAGAELADLVGGVLAVPGGRIPLEAIRRAVDVGFDPSGVALAQLRPGSDLLEGLDAAGIPPGVAAYSIGARADVVVPAGAARWPGAHHTIVSPAGWHDHDAVPGSPEVTVELALARAGAPLRCRSYADTVADEVLSGAISAIEEIDVPIDG